MNRIKLLAIFVALYLLFTESAFADPKSVSETPKGTKTVTLEPKKIEKKPLTVRQEAEKSPFSLFDVSFTTALGTYLSSEDPQTSLILTPFLRYRFTEVDSAIFHTTLTRPTDSHENFALPSLFLGWDRNFEIGEFSARLRSGALFLDIDNWGNDGANIRPTVSLRLTKPILIEGLTIGALIGPFYQFNTYKQRRSGSDNVRFGLSEVGYLSYQTGKVLIDLRLSIQQSYTSVWRNQYATYQAVSYHWNDYLSAGVSHELLSSLVDPTTGRYRSLEVFDSRRSQVSIFVTLTLGTLPRTEQ